MGCVNVKAVDDDIKYIPRPSAAVPPPPPPPDSDVRIATTVSNNTIDENDSSEVALAGINVTFHGHGDDVVHVTSFHQSHESRSIHSLQAPNEAAASKRSSVKSFNSDYDDPFANMSETDDQYDYTYNGVARTSFSSRFKDPQGSISYTDFELPTTGKLNDMMQSGNFTYTANKMTEIELVKEQALNLKDRFDLFFNPMLVRAVLEIVKAKETQIQKAFERGDIDVPSYTKLIGSLEEARNAVAKKTNTNTVKTTRRMLRRTRTAGSIFEATSMAKTKSKWQPTLPPLFADRKTSVSISTMKESVSRMGIPTTPRANSDTGVNIKSLLHICVNEAFETMLHDLKDELVECMAMAKNFFLIEMLNKRWKRCDECESPLGEQARVLDHLTKIVELYHPRSQQFKSVRSKIKQMTATLSVVALQMASPEFAIHFDRGGMTKELARPVEVTMPRMHTMSG